MDTNSPFPEVPSDARASREGISFEHATRHEEIRKLHKQVSFIAESLTATGEDDAPDEKNVNPLDVGIGWSELPYGEGFLAYGLYLPFLEHAMIVKCAKRQSVLQVHRHPKNKQRLSVISGKVRFWRDVSDEWLLTPDDGLVVVPEGVEHAMKVESSSAVIVVEFVPVEVNPHDVETDYAEEESETTRPENSRVSPESSKERLTTQP